MNYLVLFFIILISFFLFLNNSEKNKIKDVKKNKFVNPKHNLIKLLNKISSSNKIILKNTVSKHIFNKYIISNNDKENIKKILTKILNSINEISKENFHIDSIESLYIEEDKSKNKRYIINTFIYDVNNYHTIKVVFDIVLLNGVEYINLINIDQSSINNLLNKYDINHENQGILLNYNIFDKDVSELLDNEYKKKHKIVPIESDINNLPDLSNTFKMEELTSMYLPPDIPTEHSPMFCENTKFQWDKNSILNKKNNCIMNQTSYEKFPNLPYDAPGVVTQRVDNNNFSWMRTQKNLSLFD